jgi:hypothetical protein
MVVAVDGHKRLRQGLARRLTRFGPGEPGKTARTPSRGRLGDGLSALLRFEAGRQAAGCMRRRPYLREEWSDFAGWIHAAAGDEPVFAALRHVNAPGFRRCRVRRLKVLGGVARRILLQLDGRGGYMHSSWVQRSLEEQPRRVNGNAASTRPWSCIGKRPGPQSFYGELHTSE